MRPMIRDVIAVLPQPPGPPADTVDGLVCGDAGREVARVAVTHLLSHELADRAAALGCNLAVTHEGVCYSHRDPFGIPASDPVCLAKRRALEALGLAVYRCHDGVHRARPDGITEGLLLSLGWENHIVAETPEASVVELPPMSALDAARHIKDRLALASIRFAGDPAAPCRRVGLLAGYRGTLGVVQPLMEDMALDLVIYGEGPEWEAPEYIRDAAHQGRGKALVVLGHAESEIPGMESLARRLQKCYPSLPVHFLRDRPVLRML